MSAVSDTKTTKYVFLYDGQSWFLKIDSLETLNDYMDMVWNIRQENLLYDIKRLKEGKHPTSDIISLCEILANAKDSDLWNEFMALREKQHCDMTHMILEGHTLYVNTQGGYCISLKWTTNRYETEKLQWPVFSEDDIRIRKWPDGTHFYAYIGPVQVKDGNTLKWNSESDARAAAMSYVNKKKPSWK